MQHYALVRNTFVLFNMYDSTKSAKADTSYLPSTFFFPSMQVNMAETGITRMSSDYANNELELFRKTVHSITQTLLLSSMLSHINIRSR